MTPLDLYDLDDALFNESDAHILCPNCAGHGCARCNSSGYIAKSILTEQERAALRELREVSALMSPFVTDTEGVVESPEEHDDPSGFIEDEEPPTGVST